MHWFTHKSEEINKCELCSEAFDTEVKLAQHFLVHRGEEPYECSVCSQKFFTESDLSSHLLTHANEKSDECQVCFEKFSEKSSLLVHILLSHTGKKLHECARCGQKFAAKKNFLEHIYTHKKDEVNQRRLRPVRNVSNSVPRKRKKKKFNTPYTCGQSPIRCHSQNRLSTHLHKEEKLYRCKICCREFATADGLSDHFLSHTIENASELCSQNLPAEVQHSNDLGSHKNSNESISCSEKNGMLSGISFTSTTETTLESHKSNFGEEPQKHKMWSPNFARKRLYSSSSFTDVDKPVCSRNFPSQNFKAGDENKQNLDEFTQTRKKLRESKMCSEEFAISTHCSSSFVNGSFVKPQKVAVSPVCSKKKSHCISSLSKELWEHEMSPKGFLDTAPTSSVEESVETCSEEFRQENNNSEYLLNDLGKDSQWKTYPQEFVPKCFLRIDGKQEIHTKNFPSGCSAGVLNESSRDMHVCSGKLATSGKPHNTARLRTSSESSHTEKPCLPTVHAGMNENLEGMKNDLVARTANEMYSEQLHTKSYSDFWPANSDEESSECEKFPVNDMSDDVSSHSVEKSLVLSSKVSDTHCSNGLLSDSNKDLQEYKVSPEMVAKNSDVQVGNESDDACSEISLSESKHSGFWFSGSDEESQDYEKCAEKDAESLPVKSTLAALVEKPIKISSQKFLLETDHSSHTLSDSESEEPFSEKQPVKNLSCSSVLHEVEKPIREYPEKLSAEIYRSNRTLCDSGEELEEALSDKLLVGNIPSSISDPHNVVKLSGSCSDNSSEQTAHISYLRSDTSKSQEACSEKFDEDNPSSSVPSDTSSEPFSDAQNVLNFMEREPHRCKICSKKFRTKKFLLSHLLTHSNNKSHECQFCHKKFATYGQLSDHSCSHVSNKTGCRQRRIKP